MRLHQICCPFEENFETDFEIWKSQPDPDDSIIKGLKAGCVQVKVHCFHFAYDLETPHI